jgi:polyhydroxybutyrate depolymerase
MMKIKLLLSIIAPLISNLSFGQANIIDSIVHQTYQRKFTIHTPTGFNALTQRALVINLHGGSGNMLSAQGFSKMNQVADQNNFVVTWPQGYTPASSMVGSGYVWADGRNTLADQAAIDDVGFIDKLIDTLVLNYNIDTTRIYICGFSNGGFMTQRIACQLTDRFAAMASLGSSMDTVLYQTCNPTKPIPMAFFNGTSDPAMPYGGGPMQNPQVTPVVPVDTAVQFWVSHNNCLSTSSVINIPDTFTTDNSTAELYNFTNCDCNADVKFYKLINGGHTWPGVYVAAQASVLGNTNRDINASIELWNFFNAHTLCNTTVGIDEQIIRRTIRIYPNPAKTELYLNISPMDKLEISISNLLGQLFLKTQNQNHLDISNLTDGIYIITITQGQNKITQKFIKE